MVHLTDRLMRLAGEIPKGHITADIGTDHGLLPIFLYTQGISPHVILSDINEGPLLKARENIAVYAPSEDFDIRLGGGLETLKEGEADSVVIAGMGGLLMVSILEEDKAKTGSFRQFVLQPRNAQDKLRKWLLAQGFAILNESLVWEGKFICEIITAAPPKRFGAAADHPSVGDATGSDLGETVFSAAGGDLDNAVALADSGGPGGWLDWEISPLLFAKQDPLLKEFIKRKMAVEEKIMTEIMAGKGTQEHDRYKAAEERCRHFAGKLELVNW